MPPTLSRLPAQDKALQLYEIPLANLKWDAFPPLNPRGFVIPEKPAWPELFQDGKPLPLAAWPNGIGYFGGFKPKSAHADGHAGFAISNDRVRRWKNALDQFHAEIWFGGHWSREWADAFLQATAIGSDGVVSMAKGPEHAHVENHAVDLHIYNLVEEMDAPGEYALEPTNQRLLVLLPKNGPHILTLSRLGEPLLQISKTSFVQFEGLHFCYARGEGVTLRDVADITFRHCTFANLGTNAIKANGRQITIEDCLFQWIGAQGIHLSGGDSKTLAHGDNLITHCEFRDFGRLNRTYAPGVSLHGVGNILENCLLHEAPHAAIMWSGQEHIIRNNEVHTVCTETGDCGALYSGRDWSTFGTVISGNWIHHIQGGHPDEPQVGIYLDDQLSGITVKHNLIEHVPMGILVGGGCYDKVEGNILHNCSVKIHLDHRGTAHRNDDTLEKKLADIPTAQEPWITRYPMLDQMRKNKSDKPIGTSIEGNDGSGGFIKPDVGVRQ